MRKKLLTFALATTMVVSTALTASAADKISGDLTVTTFFTEKTDFVPFKDGADYTFKFKNKSNGTNNWENYVLCVTSASSADKKGTAEDEALVIRADNWGWGGSLSDFVAPDQTGNPLTFTTDITDWSTWPTEMAAGVDCVVNIARSGNKITYSATVGTHTFSMEATSGVDLPADLYLFFTGENCNLTGFSTTVNTSGTTTASTTASSSATTSTSTSTDSSSDDTDASTDSSSSSSSSSTTTTSGDSSSSTTVAGSTSTTTAASTGDMAPVAVALMLGAAAAVVVLKKRSITE